MNIDIIIKQTETKEGHLPVVSIV